MTRALLIALLIALAGCSSQLQVLAPQERVDARTPVEDAGADAERPRDPSPDGGRDANSPTGDGSVAPQLERVVSAFAQTCAVIDRVLSCWGENSSGQAGVPGDAAVLSPVRIDAAQFVDVCAGEFHSCALRDDGAALCWGDNANGQLGLGDFRARERPTELSSLRWAALACGGRNTCALTARGELYCWGENKEGRLGQADPPPDQPGTLPDSPTPIAVRPDLRFDQLSLGQGHACAVTNMNELFCWGRNSEGQLGLRDPTMEQRAPVQVEPGSKFASVAAGQRHSCAIDSDGKLSCWGQSGAGLLGLSSDQPIVRTPAQVGNDSDWKLVLASWFHSCALKKSGGLYCWGRNEEGQLGLGDMTTRNVPTRVGPEGVWRSMAVGQFHTCALGTSSLWCWGVNDVGQLGLGDTARRYVPIQVTLP